MRAIRRLHTRLQRSRRLGRARQAQLAHVRRPHRESVVLKLADKYKITGAEVNDLVDTYKPFRRTVKKQNVKYPLNMPTKPPSMQVFTNMTDGQQAK